MLNSSKLQDKKEDNLSLFLKQEYHRILEREKHLTLKEREQANIRHFKRHQGTYPFPKNSTKSRT